MDEIARKAPLTAVNLNIISGVSSSSFHVPGFKKHNPKSKTPGKGILRPFASTFAKATVDRSVTKARQGRKENLLTGFNFPVSVLLGELYRSTHFVCSWFDTAHHPEFIEGRY